MLCTPPHCTKDVYTPQGSNRDMWRVQPLLFKCQPHLLLVFPVNTKEDLTTESQRYNCTNSSGGNASCTRLDGSPEVANLPPILAIDEPVTRHSEITVTRKKSRRSSQKDMENPVLGLELRNTGLTNLVNSSRRRKYRGHNSERTRIVTLCILF
jgi:hypothetical protein